ncbi:WD40-repeat-containing domain protein [Fimicolochytrium jonesii]|uniref:WD40-repeat-containing domain protein n=1 Tax=Fimicolochytrium jonesii TaxID=1396493 RepID=UPI0022FF3081|nr:WD40-repeat-containing domain protein [Fimicolochytrium jonesii]KAI8818610.1 WD40-repeat-containing domain protein [Fimicolochytrium jonesii]
MGTAWAERRVLRLGDTPALSRHINDLPDELFISILANLDHNELRQTMLVCRRWKRILSDDSCWRSAFLVTFGGLPLRRLGESSWRKEYMKRVQLLRSFQRGKHIVQFDPRVGTVDELFVDYEDGIMYCGSIETGMVAFCHPSTGRVEKGFVYCHPDRLPQRVSALLLDRRRLAIGSLTGSVSIIMDFKDRANYGVQSMPGPHTGPVTCLSWIPNVPHLFLSGSTDASVKLWDMRTMTCRYTFKGIGTSGITHIVYDKKHGVVAGNADGDVTIWAFDAQSAASPSNQADAVTFGTARLLPQKDRSVVGPVVAMLHDQVESTLTVMASTGVVGDICRWDLQTGQAMDILTGGHSAPITAGSFDLPGSTSITSGNDRVLLASGDSSGTVCIWAFPRRPTWDKEGPVNVVKPFRAINAHRSGITQVRLDPFKLVSGGADGSVKCHDLLTGQCIRTLAVRRARDGNEGPATVVQGQNRRGVRCIFIQHHQVIVGSGDHIKCWDFGTYSGSATSGKGKRKKIFATGGNRQANVRAERNMMHSYQRHEIRTEVEEDRLARDHDREVADRLTRRANKLNGTAAFGAQLSEEELFEHAMRVSLQDSHLMSAPALYEDDLMEALERSVLDIRPDHSSSTRDEEDLAFSEGTAWQAYQGVDNEWEEFPAPSLHRPSSHGLVYGSSAGSSSSHGRHEGRWEQLMTGYDVEATRRRSSHGNVQVANRLPSSSAGFEGVPRNEEEELQYVLELSKVEL